MADELDKLWDKEFPVGIPPVGYDPVMVSSEWINQLKNEWDKLQEDAEKWRELCNSLKFDVSTPIEIVLMTFHAVNTGHQDKIKKLEAIKTLCRTNPQIEYDDVSWFRQELFKLLGVEL